MLSPQPGLCPLDPLSSGIATGLTPRAWRAPELESHRWGLGVCIFTIFPDAPQYKNFVITPCGLLLPLPSLSQPL